MTVVPGVALTADSVGPCCADVEIKVEHGSVAAQSEERLNRPQEVQAVRTGDNRGGREWSSEE